MILGRQHLLIHRQKQNLSATEYAAYTQRSEILLQMINATLDYQKSKQSLVFTQGFY